MPSTIHAKTEPSAPTHMEIIGANVVAVSLERTVTWVSENQVLLGSS